MKTKSFLSSRTRAFRWRLARVLDMNGIREAQVVVAERGSLQIGRTQNRCELAY